MQASSVVLPHPRAAHESSRARRDRRTADLAARLATATGCEHEQIVQELVRINMPVARMLARHYAGRGVVGADLEQVALLGLVAAARRYDAQRGADFLAYAVPTIKGELRKHFRDAGWTVRPPRRLQEFQPQLWVAEDELTQQLGRSPTPTEIAGHLDVDVDTVIEALAVDGCFAPSSLDLPFGGEYGGGTLADLQGDDDPQFERMETILALGPAVRRLAPRDRRIIELRFYHGWSQQQIGEEIGVTQMQVSRLLARILTDLRTALEPVA